MRHLNDIHSKYALLVEQMTKVVNFSIANSINKLLPILQLR